MDAVRSSLGIVPRRQSGRCHRTATAAVLLAILASLAGCRADQPAGRRPNVIWVLWDTVRMDRLSLYGYSRPTTPNLERWARGARVFENVHSTASSTGTSHASMFTGLLPTQHGTSEGHRWLDAEQYTLAERLRDAGYQTYLWSSNPHVSEFENFQQGFTTAEHPWSPRFRERATRIAREKSMADPSTRALWEAQRGPVNPWMINAAGELAQEGLLTWLSHRDRGRPFFAFVNYMDAHRPYLPARAFRERMMSAEQVERSYLLDQSWQTCWEFTLGLRDFPPEDLEVLGATYDAGLAGLDELFDRLTAALSAGGFLEDTVVIVTSDHGEHLGEHHLFDHQYSLYEPVLRVPLVVHYPARFEPGRDTRPVSNFDLFPTVLELAGVAADGAGPATETRGGAVSLLHAPDERTLLAEYPAAYTTVFERYRIAERFPNWDPSPWRRRLRAMIVASDKLIWSDDGRPELYDLTADPRELDNRAVREPEFAARMGERLSRTVASWVPAAASAPTAPLSQEHQERLRALGY